MPGREARLLVLLVAVSSALHLAVGASTPLWQEEAFLWMQSRHPAACYYHNPPLVSWLVALSTGLLGDTTVAVRLPAVVLSAATVLLVHRLGLALFRDPRVALGGALLVLVAPWFNAFSVIVFHQTPLYTFYSAALLALVRARDAAASGRRGLGSWLALGLAAGLAALSQYIAALLLPIGALVLLTDRRARGPAFGGFGPWVAVAVAAAVASPVFVWGASHDWENLRWHLVVRYDEAREINPTRALQYLGLQAIAASPILYAALLAAGIAAIARSRDPAFRFVAVAGGLPVALFGALSPFIPVFAYYAAPGFIALGVGLSALAFEDRGGAWRRAAVAGGLLAALMTLVLGAGVVYHRAAERLFPGAIEEHFARPSLGEKVRALRDAAPPDRRPFLLAPRDYEASAAAWFARLPDDTYSAFHSAGHRQFHFWPPAGGAASLVGRDAIYVSTKVRGAELNRLRAAFDSVEAAEPLLYGKGRRWKFGIAICRGFRGFGDDPSCTFSHSEAYTPLGR